MTHLPEIPGYTTETRLGEGGISAVFMGQKLSTGQKVAIKLLEPDLHQDETLTHRFFQEVATITSLDHKNIIKILDFGHMGSYYYMVMEYLSESLQDRIAAARGESLVPAELETVKRIASALHYAHQKGIVHRDIKPDNIMFRDDGTPVLLDFGIAKLVQSQRSLTKAGITLGTPDYMSPEQIQGLTLDGRSDLYSLGVVIYELITGEVPYTANDFLTLAKKHMSKKTPKLPRKFKFYQPLIDKTMAKAREARVQDGAELVRLIAKFQ